MISTIVIKFHDGGSNVGVTSLEKFNVNQESAERRFERVFNDVLAIINSSFMIQEVIKVSFLVSRTFLRSRETDLIIKKDCNIYFRNIIYNVCCYTTNTKKSARSR